MGRLTGGRLWGAAALAGMVLLAACAPAGPAAPGSTRTTPAAGASAPGAPAGAAPAVQPTAGAAPASPPPLTRMTVGYGSAGGGYIPLWVAGDGGSFERYGLDVELVLLPGNLGPQSLVSGQVPIVGLTGFSSAPAMIEGADLLIIASVVNKLTALVYGVPGVDSPQALRGKRLAITRPGTLTHFGALLALRAWGFKPEQDVTFVSLNEVPAILTGMHAGAADAGVLTDLTAFTAAKQGFPLLVDLADLPTDYLASGFTTTNEYARQNRPLLLNFLKGYAEGLKRYYDDKPFAVEMIRKYVKIEDPEVQDRTYDVYAQKYYQRVPLPSVRSMQNILDDLAEANPRAREVDAARLVDPSFVQQLQAEGFFRQVGLE
jgi:NitT/TauT family transport system substrate-binding protein